MKTINKLFLWLFRGLIHLYRATLSPLFTGRCRFQPTCSAYALEALEKHGPWRGAWLIARRLGSCHPWGGSGYHPVPDSVRVRRRKSHEVMF